MLKMTWSFLVGDGEAAIVGNERKRLEDIIVSLVLDM